MTYLFEFTGEVFGDKVASGISAQSSACTADIVKTLQQKVTKK